MDFLKVFKIGKNVVKGEVQEIVNLKPTEDDYKQGEQLATVAAGALATMGIPIPAVGITIIGKAFAYGIRDIRDGVEEPDKLIIGRIIEEIKGEKNEKA